MRLTLDTLVLLAIGIVITIALLMPMPVRAETTPCGAVDDVLSTLASDYDEAPLIMARGPGRGLIFVAEPSGGTWTLLQIAASGIVCVVAADEAWELIDQPRPGVPS